MCCSCSRIPTGRAASPRRRSSHPAGVHLGERPRAVDRAVQKRLAARVGTGGGGAGVSRRLLSRLARSSGAEVRWRARSGVRNCLQRVRASVHEPQWDRRHLASALARGKSGDAARRALRSGDWQSANHLLTSAIVRQPAAFVIAPSMRDTLVERIATALSIGRARQRHAGRPHRFRASTTCWATARCGSMRSMVHRQTGTSIRSTDVARRCCSGRRFRSSIRCAAITRSSGN